MRRRFIPTRNRVVYLLRDDFGDTVAAGSVNGTTATPTGGTRVVSDTNNKLSIGSGVANFATGGSAAMNPAMWYAQITRAAGRALVIQVTPASNSADHVYVGWDNNQLASTITDGVKLGASAVVDLVANGGAGFTVGTYTAVSHYIAVVQRATGVFYFIKGGAYTNWTLLYMSKANTSNGFPAIAALSTTSVYTSDFVRVPVSLIAVTPLVSDGFGGTWGTTGGAGSEESGGTGLTWTAQKGTWGSAAGVASCSALTDSLGIATVPCGTANVIAEAVITRSAGNMGMALRYTDADNYIKVYYDGTNWQVDDIVGGTPNTILAATAATYGATKRTVVSLNGTKLRLYYGDAAVGAESTTAVTTGNAHGLFTTNTGATFDNFVVWSKGNGGEYESTFNRYTV